MSTRLNIRRRTAVALVLATLIGTSPGFGQQGHPLSGSWHGEWGPPGDRTDLTVIINRNNFV